ncbi:MAG: hypothetical protein AAGA56_17620 [Myxococcota bacterium]
MPRSAEDVESFLLELNRTFDRTDDMFIVSTGAEGTPIAIQVADPVVVVRVNIGAVPDDAAHQLPLFRKLLELNGSDLVHASYAVTGHDEIILSAGLELESLDKNELEAVMSDIDIALARHVSTLWEVVHADLG